MRPADENLIYKYAILLGEKAFKPIKKDNEVKYLGLFFFVRKWRQNVQRLPYFYGVNIDLGKLLSILFSVYNNIDNFCDVHSIHWSVLENPAR